MIPLGTTHAGQWDTFLTDWARYKKAQRDIYAIVVATLQVGTSISYARSVPYGEGTNLLQVILRDNRRNTTRALFALMQSLFALRLKENENFETYHRRFQSMLARFNNWVSPVVLPPQLLLFFLMRNLPDPPFGAVRHIIMATDNIFLFKGTQLLRDVGQTEATIITATLGSASPSPILTPDNVLAVATPPQDSKTNAPADPRRQQRQRQMTPLRKIQFPCVHHGKKSLHATCECTDPQLLRSRKRRTKDGRQQQQTPSGGPVANRYPAPVNTASNPVIPAIYTAPHPQMSASPYPPTVYHPHYPPRSTRAPVQQPPVYNPAYPPQAPHGMFVIVTVDDDAYLADSEGDDDSDRDTEHSDTTPVRMPSDISSNAKGGKHGSNDPHHQR